MSNHKFYIGQKLVWRTTSKMVTVKEYNKEGNVVLEGSTGFGWHEWFFSPWQDPTDILKEMLIKGDKDEQ